MFQNYLKTAVRNLLRYKGFTLINIAGLSLGFIGCLVIGLFVWDEWQYDKNIPDGAQIYRLYEERKDNNSTTYSAVTPPAFATFLQQQYPEVEGTARILMDEGKYLMEVGTQAAFETKGWFVDSSFFRIFKLKLLQGNPATALQGPASIVLSEALAKKYFGNENPIGKTVRINKSDLEVKGVLAKLPPHFHLDFNYLMSLPAAGLEAARMERWTWHQFYTYVKLKKGASASQLEQKFQAHVKKDIFPTLTQDGSTFLPFFQPLSAIHLQSSNFIYDNALRGNQTSVNALVIIALFVLLIAGFNFINLATARSFRRAKEIGIRKVAGAGRNQLVAQFIGETVLLSLFSLLVAVLVTLPVVPLLNQFTGKSIRFDPLNPVLALLLLSGGIFIGVLAGAYPALVLSGFQPIKVLKNIKPVRGGSGSWLRPALVVVQFSLSVLLIIATLVVYRQTKFLNSKDLGFSKEQVLYFQVREGVQEKLETFTSELKKSPAIASVTTGYGLPGDAYAGDGISIQTSEGEKEYGANVFIGDHDYVKTLGLKIIAGRDFSRDHPTDKTEAFLINEAAVQTLGFGSPEKAIGQPVSWNEWQPQDTSNPVKRGRVIGVVQDFHYKSLHEKITTSVIHIYPQVTYTVAAKLKAGEVQNAIAHISNTWNKFATGYPLDYRFMDESFGSMYQSEEKLSSLLWVFALTAIVVGCMGLFGLAAFSAEQRTKEIGIRKVLGATLLNIIGLLSKSFLLLVGLASLIALPVAWWALNNWLADFPYRVTINWWVFGIAVLAALVIALLTVSFQAVKAALANPVKSLRTE